MAGIEIHTSYVAGMATVLMERPDALPLLHMQAENFNRGLAITHKAIRGTFNNTSYGRDIIHAIDVGVMTYETLTGDNSNRIPSEFVLHMIEEREKNPNLALQVAEQMDKERKRLVASDPFFAQTLVDVCASQIGDSSLSEYSLGAAALVRTIHDEIDTMWRLTRIDPDYLTELMDLS